MRRKIFAKVFLFLAFAVIFPCICLASQNDLGGLSPKDAFDYMKENYGELILIDVAPTRWFQRETFTGALHIPEAELDGSEKNDLYMKLPADKPVLLYCRMGITVPKVYDYLIEFRPDIKEIAYIAGAPMFKEYNSWLAAKTVDSSDEQVQK